MKKFEMRDFITELEYLEESKNLLDYILAHYDYYSGEFSHISDWDKSYNKDSLNMRIRNYKKFDDSE